MTSPNRPKKRESGSSKSAHSTPKSSKSVPLFDLASLSEELPPNTGPPDTSTTNGSNSSSNPSKSLSHVPCKFFRQGICQAGKSCPFSHDLEGTASDKLPCKYFQKGNCKFGLKCALAHILPDGTHINAKPPSHSRRSRYERSISHNNSSQAKYSGDQTLFIHSGAQGSSQSTSFGTQKKDTEPVTPRYQAENSHQGGEVSPTQTDILDGYGDRSFQPPYFTESNTWSTHYSSNILSLPPSLANNPRRNTFSATGNHTSLWLEESPTLYDNGSSIFLHSNSTPIDSRTLSKSNIFGSASSPLYNFTKLSAEESTSLDEDSDAIFGEENANYEDYVPASIGNLILTPQEQQRRESRSQSGTLLVRPNMSLNCQQEKSQGSIELITRGFDDVFLMD